MVHVIVFVPFFRCIVQCVYRDFKNQYIEREKEQQHHYKQELKTKTESVFDACVHEWIVLIRFLYHILNIFPFSLFLHTHTHIFTLRGRLEVQWKFLGTCKGTAGNPPSIV